MEQKQSGLSSSRSITPFNYHNGWNLLPEYQRNETSVSHFFSFLIIELLDLLSSQQHILEFVQHCIFTMFSTLDPFQAGLASYLR